MIDYAKRLRSGALLASLTVVAFHIALGLGHFGLLISRGVRFGPAAQQSGASSVPLIWIFVVLALSLASTLVQPPVRHARRLVSAATIAVSVAAAVGLISWVFGLFGGFTLGTALAAVGGLIETLAKVACAAVLWRLRQVTESDAPAVDEGAASAEQTGQQPVWNPQQAIGLQWHRAGDAATGAAAPPAVGTGEPAAPQLPPAPILPAAPEPARPQPWSRGGIPAEQLAAAQPPVPAEQPAEDRPWTTAAQAAAGVAPAPDGQLPDLEEQTRRPAPDWTPARPPQDGDS